MELFNRNAKEGWLTRALCDERGVRARAPWEGVARVQSRRHQTVCIIAFLRAGAWGWASAELRRASIGRVGQYGLPANTWGARGIELPQRDFSLPAKPNIHDLGESHPVRIATFVLFDALGVRGLVLPTCLATALSLRCT
jgi:hypothetical protein